MRKSNWLVVAIAVVASAILLWVWFTLGFNRVDSPPIWRPPFFDG